MASSTTYYTTGTGDWTDNIWSTDTNGVGGALPTLVAGDILVIDDDITINVIKITIVVDVTINLDAELSIEKQLDLTANSIISFTSNGSVVATGGGNSSKIKIGNGPAVWSTGDGPITGPGILDENSSNGVLPIELLFFEAARHEDKTNLTWATASEENFDYFEVQRAIGSIAFEVIEEIKGAGADSYTIQEYEFVDEKPLNGINYYRLKSIDLDGTFEYSPIQSVKFSFESRFRVYPNPSNGVELNILIDDFDPRAEYLLYDNMGLLVDRGFITGNDHSYSLPNLKPGVYHVKLKGHGDDTTAKLVVH